MPRLSPGLEGKKLSRIREETPDPAHLLCRPGRPFFEAAFAARPGKGQLGQGTIFGPFSSRPISGATTHEKVDPNP